MLNLKNTNILSWLCLGVITALSIYFGINGFLEHASRHNDAELTVLDSFYRTLQLFTLDSGAQKGPIPLQLEIARWLALLATFSAVIKGIWFLLANKTKTLLQLKQIKNHVIICGAGRQGFQIARQLLNQKSHRVVLIDINPSNPYLAEVETDGAIIIIADASVENVLEKVKINTARYLISTTGDDLTNIEIIRHAKQLKTNNHPLDCYAHVKDNHTKTLFYHHHLFSESKKQFNARLFNVLDQAARLLFAEYTPDIFKPIRQTQDLASSILIFGFTSLTESILLHAAKTGCFANRKKMEITVIDQHAETALRILYMAHPELEKVIEIKLLNYSAESLEPDAIKHILAINPDVIYICIVGDIKAVTLAGSIQTHCEKQQLIPIVVNLLQRDTLSHLLKDNDQLKQSNIHLFPLLEKTNDVDYVIGQQLDHEAKIIHHMYCEDQMALGDTREKNPTLMPWDDLPEGIKDSNRGQADHLAIKLRAIGLDLKELIATTIPIVFTEQQIHTLADMEHQRWRVGKILDGWCSTEGKKDLANKRTPLLIDFDQLPPEERHKDEQSISVHIPKLIQNLRNNKR